MKTQTKNQMLETATAMGATEAETKKLQRASKMDIELWIQLHADQPDTPDEAETKNMSKTMQKYREGYEPSISASGRKSLNTGDAIAHLLAGLEPLAVMQAAEVVLGLEDGELVTKYEKLNRGQQRMNAGNRIRSAAKRGDITVADLEKVVVH